MSSAVSDLRWHFLYLFSYIPSQKLVKHAYKTNAVVTIDMLFISYVANSDQINSRPADVVYEPVPF